MPEVKAKDHIFNAEATVLSGNLTLPVKQTIEPQAHSKLDSSGGYFNQTSDGYALQSIISFDHAYSHVAGNKSLKDGEGWNTLTTTVVEGLNVMEVVTADRVVGQTITHHPLVGHMPSISFLGTRYENLRIAGIPVELEWDQEIYTLTPENDLAYALDPGLISRAGRQYSAILQNMNLSPKLQKHYNQLSKALGVSETIECSLVNRVAGLFPGTIAGNVISIPGFGSITLGKVTVKHESPLDATKTYKKTTFTLTMIDLNLGCVIEGDVPIGTGGSNGGPK
jgi:hypothetical protein